MFKYYLTYLKNNQVDRAKILSYFPIHRNANPYRHLYVFLLQVGYQFFDPLFQFVCSGHQRQAHHIFA